MPPDATESVADLIARWAATWNACDVDGILEIVHPDFRMHRLKGDVIDRQGLVEVVGRQSYGSATKFFPLRLYRDGDRFAVAMHIEYRHVEDDELVGETDDGGMTFQLRDDLVVSAAPQPTSSDALAKAELAETDKVFDWEGR